MRAKTIDDAAHKIMNGGLRTNYLAELEVLPPRRQGPCVSEPFETWDLPDGTNWVSFFRTGSGFLIRFPDLADVEVSTDGRSVTSVPVPGVSEVTTEHLYMNQVLPLAISKRGKLVFHGSAVDVGDCAIAFLAPSGRG